MSEKLKEEFYTKVWLSHFSPLARLTKKYRNYFSLSEYSVFFLISLLLSQTPKN